uniref:F-box domain-containing protein n=1 Tax=Oryza nivara TaxID=4536 RepID=A0A0E0J3W0_ORYNI
MATGTGTGAVSGPPSWLDLPLGIVGAVLSRLHSSADRAALRSVFHRSWRAATRERDYPPLVLAAAPAPLPLVLYPNFALASRAQL